MNLTKLNVEIWYLFHSGFAIKTPNHFLVFDYYSDTPTETDRSLLGGVINPAEIKDLDVMVFSSHSHGDHFNPKILTWEKDINKINYILSHDIKVVEKSENITKVFPGHEYEIDNIKIKTLNSTDKGVAFLIEVDGITIYHAGDLNWWHWEGEAESANLKMGKNYKEQINLLKDTQIDIAFVPIDLRLEKNYLLGLDYLVKTTDIKTIFPMHFGDDFSVFGCIKEDTIVTEYLSRIKEITHRGEKFVL